MEPDRIILTFLGIGVLVLVIFLYRRNQKDRRSFEQQMNRDYKKPAKHEDDDLNDDRIG